MINNEIYEVPSNRRYWMIRSSGGHYYNHFTSNNCIGIGHLNVLDLESKAAGEFNSTEAELRHALRLKGFEKKRFDKYNRQLKQAAKFIHEMAIGDWIITVGQAGYRYGVITSKAYIEREPVVLEGEVRGYRGDADMHLRRRVNWGPVIRREHVPYGLAQALRARQTVTCLDDHWQALCHSLYPVFTKQNELYLSVKIGTDKPINSYSIGTLFTLFSEIEVLAKEFENHFIDKDFNREQFDAVFKGYLNAGLLTVSNKAQYQSPGDAWFKFVVDKYPIALGIWFASAVLLGNDVIGMQGIITDEAHQKLLDSAFELLLERDVSEELKGLELDVPKFRTGELEVPVERELPKLPNMNQEA
ncbi:conserved hypothetical protein [Vibrio crassostreae]|nr:conserved hypothetical protein [Vibrio crassostreae]CAK2358482.1 conserved hypothetical protein [Vibrio crassostreae]CAK2436261.1 conserved hypothetical protein [Vibrio crassostreae]CAK3040786.1 conserved hypothetical protein [Vibrio crassostreae]